MLKYNTLAALLAVGSCIPACTAPAVQEDACKGAYDVVKRISPDFADKVRFELALEAEHATLSTRDNQLLITAKDISECIRAYGYYLRHIAHVHISWNGDNFQNARFVLPQAPVIVPDTLPFNYALNYCTLCYSGAHWDKQRWERELDKMALEGYKNVLVTAGLEKVWQNFLRELNYPEEKIAKFIPNPCFSAWWNMGNLEGAGGPVSQSIIDEEAALGKFIVQRLHELGMEACLQGYVGFLPHDFPAESLKDSKILPQGKWCNFERPAVLSPVSPDFPRVAALWYKKLHEVYGSKGIAYGGDLFHEGGKKGDTPLKEAAQEVQKAMQAAAPGSKWLIQAWGHNPTDELLSGVDPKNAIILALEKNMYAGKEPTRDYKGIPHVWCELANFGGNHGLYGGFPLLENLTDNAGNAIGLGLLSEGVETNPIYYALFTERLNHRGTIDRNEFIANYVRNRYGKSIPEAEKAWALLADSVYAPNHEREGCKENILCARPDLVAQKVSTWADEELYYKPESVLEAARLLQKAGEEHPELQSLETYRYDMADVCRQVLADRAVEQLPACAAAFRAKDLEQFRKETASFLQLLTDSADVLACSKYFLLGSYLQGAENKFSKPEDKKAMVRNLKMLISTWSPQIDVLDDYAHRQLSEMMTQYYAKRWQQYFASRERELQGCATEEDKSGKEAGEANENNGQKVYYVRDKNKHVDAVELSFPDDDIQLLTEPQGDLMQIAKRILQD